MEGIHIVLKAETLGIFFGIPVTNALITTVVVSLLVAGAAILAGRRLRLIPGRIQMLWEMVVGDVYEYVAGVLESHDLAKRYFPLIASIFIVILFGNLLAFLPGFGSVGFYHAEGGKEVFVPLLRATATDLNFTLALAIVAFIMIEFAGVAVLGVLKYGSKFVNLKSPIGFAIGVIDLFSEIARLFSFSFRLFGNIFAGEVMLGLLAALIPIVLPVPLMAFEVAVGVIQAAIFALLTLFFIKIAVTEMH
ncbi:ATP synthase F0 subunit A [Candidatus Kaiserbacteria bacterium RIFCSPHIGHO2_02_FULL_50_9]|uniref:ATP synthase subunit a n=1 Tax=Candidatus Kaiserbacteria bacterium RIFCSPLOWO2_01_FULL_51_21 TaxID=1798508 RepID=A0A1F6EDM6_9BACT|nr:MAG: ATP synthase F0 subunit A [Candidatus Kaiserbacteria bacterium RIFCSPHIGHO2_01_FULL_51_33]OGG63603.1 MAG: ATP synthase F0 subunit A [Candidatus Kaiserbacteria bacterium RIFCSPHIGHO2_02_FULL_50_9]OGG71756.1 MAG: ATP synthase F0 subunit A [Candidatus Kaiserbacteria bacterium RIFCSPLOWO2_01_FULL_51_21]